MPPNEAAHLTDAAAHRSTEQRPLTALERYYPDCPLLQFGLELDILTPHSIQTGTCQSQTMSL